MHLAPPTQNTIALGASISPCDNLIPTEYFGPQIGSLVQNTFRPDYDPPEEKYGCPPPETLEAWQARTVIVKWLVVLRMR